MSRLTLSDRIRIQMGIYSKLSVAEIAVKLGKSRKCISQEIKRNRTFVRGAHVPGKDCRLATGCKRVGLCGKPGCHRRCCICLERDCQTICKGYDNHPCPIMAKPPYVCNICRQRRTCQIDRNYYEAYNADAAAKRRFSESRSKPRLTKEEMEALDQLVSPLILKGQPLTHICAEHGSEIPVCERTLYNYIDSGRFKINNLNLRRKVGYKPRKKQKQSSEAFLNQEFRIHRTYKDFTDYMARHPNTPYVEMDTVKGCREKGKRMLTLLFVEQNLMLIFLMKDGMAETVTNQFDWLTAALGLEVFRKLFPVILTDNGSEFKHTHDIEFTLNGERRTRVFYCDPQASWQKAHIEKNHEYIRYVLPKGKSFNPLTQEDVTLLLNHINSTRRSKLNGNTPFELANSEEFQQLKAVMGLEQIPADEVSLSPRLLKQTK